jgi:hypothetical protein
LGFSALLAKITDRAALSQALASLHRLEAVALAGILALASVFGSRTIGIALALMETIAMDRIFAV